MNISARRIRVASEGGGAGHGPPSGLSGSARFSAHDIDAQERLQGIGRRTGRRGSGTPEGGARTPNDLDGSAAPGSSAVPAPADGGQAAGPDAPQLRDAALTAADNFQLDTSASFSFLDFSCV